MRSTCHALLACAVPLFALPSLRAQWTCVALSPAGSTNSYATATAGSRQAGYAEFAGVNHAGMWSATAASFVDLHPTGWSSSRILGMSATTAVGYTYSGPTHAAMWVGSSGTYVSMHPPSAQSSTAYATSGSRTVGVVDGHAAVWSGTLASSWADLNPPGSALSYAFAVAGMQIGGAVYPNLLQPPHAALWNAGGFVDLHPANSSSSFCYGVGNGQQVGVATVGSQNHAALWAGSAGSFVDLSPSAMSTSVAYAVAAGMQVGVTTAVAAAPHAALWRGTAASRVDLHAFVPSGFLSSTATAVWTDGTTVYVVGHGVYGSYDRALLWTAPATPSFVATNTTLGTGCNGLTLGASTRPVLGTNWSLAVNGIPTSAIFGASVFGLADPGILDLAAYGMPGCQQRAGLDAVLGPWTPVGSAFGYAMSVPVGPPSLLGLRFFTQAVVFTSPPMNVAGVITSNGIVGMLGDL